MGHRVKSAAGLLILGLTLAWGLAAVGAIHGYVYEDLPPLGTNRGEDRPLSHVAVHLFWDKNGNGTLDSGDGECSDTATDGSGYFSFSSGCNGELWFVVVDSRSIVSSRGLESGYSEDDIWAEETYQSVYDKGGSSWPRQKMFGGRNPEVSDDFSNEVYEHWIAVDPKVYHDIAREPDLVFGFSFEVVVSSRDVDEDGASGSGRSAQGTLRQFLENARAITGADHSYFVFKAGEPREIVVDPSLWMNGGGPYNRAAHPGYLVATGTTLDGHILGWDLQPTGEVVLLNTKNYPDDCFLFLLTGDQGTIENLEIRGNTEEVPKTGIRGIRLSGATYCTVQNVEAYNCHIGVELYWNAQYNTIKNVTAHDNSHSGIYFYWTPGAHNLYNTVSGCRSYANRYAGIGLYYDSDNNLLKDNEVYGNGWAGIWIGYLCDNNTVRGNYAHGNSVAGILISTWPGYDAKGNLVTENVTEGNGGFWGTLPGWGTVVNYDSGIGLYNAHDTVVSDNTVKNNYSAAGPVYGIAIDGGSTGSQVQGNEITGNGIGIAVVDSQSQRNAFSRNAIYSNRGLGIDLGADGVTLNEGALNSGAPNQGVDYPVFTVIKRTPTGLHLEGYIGGEDAGTGSPDFAGAKVEIFLVRNATGGDDLAGNEHAGRIYGEGWRYLGSTTAGPDGSFTADLPVAPELLSPPFRISGTTTLPGAGTSEFGALFCDPTM